MPTTLLLVRHGQSTWNAAGRWQGTADPPLSDLGIDQARAAGAALADGALARLAPGAAISAVVTSDLSRARQTGALVAEALGLPPPSEHPGVRERQVGEWTGLTRDEIEQRYPGALERWPSDPPGGERLDDVAARVEAALVALRARHRRETVVVVTHGGVIRTVERLMDHPKGGIPNLVCWPVVLHDDHPTTWRGHDRLELALVDGVNEPHPAAP